MPKEETPAQQKRRRLRSALTQGSYHDGPHSVVRHGTFYAVIDARLTGADRDVSHHHGRDAAHNKCQQLNKAFWAERYARETTPA
jgi:hypothetical protein